MKKELIMLGSMVAMSAALSSCCCKRGADAAYRQSQQNTYVTAPRVVNYKDGGAVRGTPGYIQPTSAEGTTLTGSRPVYQPAQPTKVVYRQVPQPVNKVIVIRDRSLDPVGITVNAQQNYLEAGSGYYGSNGCYYGYSRGGSRGCGVVRHIRVPNYHSPRVNMRGTIGNKYGYLGGHNR